MCVPKRVCPPLVLKTVNQGAERFSHSETICIYSVILLLIVTGKLLSPCFLQMLQVDLLSELGYLRTYQSLVVTSGRFNKFVESPGRSQRHLNIGVVRQEQPLDDLLQPLGIEPSMHIDSTQRGIWQYCAY